MSPAVGPDGLRRAAAALAAGTTDALDPADRPALSAVADLPPAEAAAYLRGAAEGLSAQEARVRAELVWTGPSVHDVPVRATVAVLTDLVGEARQELILTTYSAKPYPPLRDALAAAVARGVTVWVVVETLQGAGSALRGEEPAAAFDLSGIARWTWTVSARPEGAKMHAKMAVVDETALLVSSANLTASGIGANMEAGLLIRGGPTPRRAAEHLRALRRDGQLVRV